MLSIKDFKPRRNYSPHGEPRYLSTIPLKDSHLFKIAKSVISFCLKKNSNSAILNRYESFSGIVDHVIVHHVDLIISPITEPLPDINFEFEVCKLKIYIFCTP